MKIEIINIQDKTSLVLAWFFSRLDIIHAEISTSLKMIKHLYLATVAICINITRVDENLGYMFPVWRK